MMKTQQQESLTSVRQTVTKCLIGKEENGIQVKTGQLEVKEVFNSWSLGCRLPAMVGGVSLQVASSTKTLFPSTRELFRDSLAHWRLRPSFPGATRRDRRHPTCHRLSPSN